MKRYVQETGRARVISLWRRRVAVSALAGVEVPAALWRRHRQGDVSREDARKLIQRLHVDLTSVLLVEMRRGVLDRAAHLVERHPLRAYDAVQLASALLLAERANSPVTFVGADRQLGEAAATEGLRAVDVAEGLDRWGSQALVYTHISEFTKKH